MVWVADFNNCNIRSRRNLFIYLFIFFAEVVLKYGFICNSSCLETVEESTEKISEFQVWIEPTTSATSVLSPLNHRKLFFAIANQVLVRQFRYSYLRKFFCFFFTSGCLCRRPLLLSNVPCFRSAKTRSFANLWRSCVSIFAFFLDRIVSICFAVWKLIGKSPRDEIQRPLCIGITKCCILSL